MVDGSAFLSKVRRKQSERIAKRIRIEPKNPDVYSRAETAARVLAVR